MIRFEPRAGRLGLATTLVLVLVAGAPAAPGDAPVLSLQATVAGAPTAGGLTVTLFRWATEAERAPLLAALSAPASAPAPPAGPAGAPAGGRGRRGRGSAPPPTPSARLTAAVRAAPTLGYVWTDGVSGYSIRYAWHGSPAEGIERIVLVTDRRLGAHALDWPSLPPAPADADFTLIELRVGDRGVGEGKTSLTTKVVIDKAAQTLALDDYAAAPVLLEVNR
jgi:hypothetical protein